MIEELVTWLQATGRSQATQQTYRRWVQRWLAAAPPGHELSPGGMRKLVLSDTVRRRRDGALAAAATQNDARAALRALGRWAVATGRRDADPAAEIGLEACRLNDPVADAAQAKVPLAPIGFADGHAS
jgi:site-specific recombinase XerD